jgi:glycosyltransferase involved in cell wall biosynthesis
VKVLIVTMFFPPTGGGGVQRSLKFAAHLPDLGFETFVIAPRNSKDIERDESLLPPPRAQVVRVRNLSPATRLLGVELHGRQGPHRLAVHARFAFRRALVPDPSVPWILTAVPAAVKLIRRKRIDVILTTSPPPSVNLIGAAVKQLTAVRWVADVRDSIAFNPHRRRDLRGERFVARLVARHADAVIAASQGIAAEFSGMGRRENLEVIESGCDFDDFSGLFYRRSDRFRITHTGSFLGRRDPRPFLDALASSSDEIVARFAGNFRQRDREYADGLGLGCRLELLPFVSHRDALSLQRDSDALLLLIPEANGRGLAVLTGKLFEYLGARRPILAAVPQDGEAATLIRRTQTGIVVSPEDVDGLRAALAQLHEQWRAGTLDDLVLNPQMEAALSCRAKVERLSEVLRGFE